MGAKKAAEILSIPVSTMEIFIGINVTGSQSDEAMRDRFPALGRIEGPQKIVGDGDVLPFLVKRRLERRGRLDFRICRYKSPDSCEPRVADCEFNPYYKSSLGYN